MVNVVVVGHGLAGRHFHAPLIRRQPELRLHGIVARNPETRAEAAALWQCATYPDLDAALADPSVDLIVLATPHDVHAEQTIQTLEAGKHCVVDKVMALNAADADRMIAARDASGKMLSVFHNRRWDWDYLTIRQLLENGRLGRPQWIESAVCRHAPPRTWRGHAAAAGTILHDWGAHLIDQALNLGLGPIRRLHATLVPAPWPGVDSGGHGRVVLEFDDVVFLIETSRISRFGKPRWWIIGSEGGFIKEGIDPQEDALRAGNLDLAAEPPELRGTLRTERHEERIETTAGSWDSYYANIAAHLLRREPLAVTAEQGREVVRVLDAALRSARDHAIIEGPWGTPADSNRERTADS